MQHPLTQWSCTAPRNDTSALLPTSKIKPKSTIAGPREVIFNPPLPQCLTPALPGLTDLAIYIYMCVLVDTAVRTQHKLSQATDVLCRVITLIHAIFFVQDCLGHFAQ